MRNKIYILSVTLTLYCLLVNADTRYVSVSGGHTPPFTNWVAAATNIAAAVSVSADGDSIIVSAGTYPVTSEIAITNAITLSAADGVDAMPVINGQGITRCLLINNPNAIVDGLIISNGWSDSYFTLVIDGLGMSSAGIGGVWVKSGTLRRSLILECRAATNSIWGGGMFGGVLVSSGLIERCEIRANSAVHGAGVGCLGGTVRQCIVEMNNASNTAGGVLISGGEVSECTIQSNRVSSFAGAKGGGVYSSGGIVVNCLILDNYAAPSQGKGGGVYLDGGTLRGSVLMRNYTSVGGGLYMPGGRVENCTIVSNTATAYGGGVYWEDWGWIINSIIYYNSPTNYTNQGNFGVFHGEYSHCCTVPPIAGDRNITNEPGLYFADGAWLLAASPCINAGTNSDWMTTATDIDGEVRVFDGKADIGTDEAVLCAVVLHQLSSCSLALDLATPVGAAISIECASPSEELIWQDAHLAFTSTARTLQVQLTNCLNSALLYRAIWTR